MVDEPSYEMDHAALRAVLGVAAQHGSLLTAAAFEAMADALEPHLRFARMAVLLHEPDAHERLFVYSRGPVPPLPFGARFSVAHHPGLAKVRVAGEPYVCDDTRTATPIDAVGAAVGYLSYLSMPIKVGPARAVAAALIVAFEAPGDAGRAPASLLEAVADLLASYLPLALDVARERRLAMIVETSGDAMIAWDREGVITDANAAAGHLSGRARHALVGTHVGQLLVPVPSEATPAHGERVELVARGGEGKDDRRVLVGVTLTHVADDPLVACHALLRDLSAVVAAEGEAALHLARSRVLEEEHRTLLDNAPLIIFRLDPRTAELVFLNLHAERLLGVPTHEALATPGFLRSAHATPEGVAAFEAAVEEARRGAVSQPYEARLERFDGDEITARGNVYPLLSEGGAVVAIEGVLADVSAEQAARTRLVQADRLSTLGTLAAGVAHEINNPAAFILLGLDMLARLLRGPGVHVEDGPRDQATALLADLREAIKRIVDITRDLRLFASPPLPEHGARTIVDVNRTVESALMLTRGQIIERARIVRFTEEVPPVLMDAGRLGQVVVNLLVNAAQAIPKEARGDHAVTISTRSDGRTVEIVVSDTGSGIRERDLARIWAPFFTTKTPDIGTGLGLSISREIIERAGGAMRVASPVHGGAVARGAEFVISLPVAGRHDSVPPISSPLPPVSGRKMRVLLVEDEAALARALAQELGALHHVDLAPGAEEALERLAQARYDVVLCDLKMPGMTGDQLYDEVAKLNPAQARRFVFMTGVGFGADVERFLALSGRPLLEKPFTLIDALELMGKVYARNGGAA